MRFARVLMLAATAGGLLPDEPLSQTLTSEAIGRSEERREMQRTARAIAAAAGVPLDSLAGDTLTQEFERAARWARDNADAFDEALALAVEFPGVFARAAQDPGAPERAVALALLAEDAERLGRLRARGRVTDTARVRSDAAALREALRISSARSATHVTIFADGNIKGAASGESVEGPVGTGSIGIAISRRNAFWTAMVAVASSSDTVSEGFGAAILSPGSGKRLYSGVLDLRKTASLAGRKLRLHGYVMSSKSSWRLTTAPETLAVNGTPTVVVDTTVHDAVIFGAGLLHYWDIVDGYVGDNYVSLKVEAGASLRWLTGDIVDQRDLLSRNLGTPKRHFGGFEGGMQISFGRVTGAIQVYWLRLIHSDRAEVVGLTHGQIIGALSVAGDIFRGRVGR